MGSLLAISLACFTITDRFYCTIGTSGSNLAVAILPPHRIKRSCCGGKKWKVFWRIRPFIYFSTVFSWLAYSTTRISQDGPTRVIQKNSRSPVNTNLRACNDLSSFRIDLANISSHKLSPAYIQTHTMIHFWKSFFQETHQRRHAMSITLLTVSKNSKNKSLRIPPPPVPLPLSWSSSLRSFLRRCNSFPSSQLRWSHLNTWYIVKWTIKGSESRECSKY